MTTLTMNKDELTVTSVEFTQYIRPDGYYYGEDYWLITFDDGTQADWWEEHSNPDNRKPRLGECDTYQEWEIRGCVFDVSFAEL